MQYKTVNFLLCETYKAFSTSTYCGYSCIYYSYVQNLQDTGSTVSIRNRDLYNFVIIETIIGEQKASSLNTSI